MTEAGKEHLEMLLEKSDFSAESDFKERLWNKLAKDRQANYQGLIIDLSEDDMARAAGGIKNPTWPDETVSC